MPTFDIQAAALPVDGIEILAGEARCEGFDFVDRLINDWERGSNRFSRPGETLLAVRTNATLIGIGGLNIDPYNGDARCGRVRHVFISARYRGRGAGRRLIATVIKDARPQFDRLRLRTSTTAADRFYQALGFHRLLEPNATHGLQVR